MDKYPASILQQNDLGMQLIAAQDEADDANEACTILYGGLLAVLAALEEGEVGLALEAANTAIESVQPTRVDDE
jgi:hypothetical protein